MFAHTEKFDLAGLRLSAGEGRRIELTASIDPLVLGGERYSSDPECVGVLLDVSRMSGEGYALRLRFRTSLAGPCMRCLQPAHPSVEVQAREVDKPGEGEELASPYVEEQTLDLATWAHDAFALAAPVQVLCREDCAGLCPICATNLNEAGPEHAHESEPDPRWAKLRELKLE
jgi:uncharacterized protein